MKYLFTLTAFFYACFTLNTAVAQLLKNEKEYKDEGALELIIDVSQMKDTKSWVYHSTQIGNIG